MSRLSINLDWEAPLDARGDELRATWARFGIVVDGVAITRVLDHEAKGYRDAIYGPLFPVAEWIARNWFFLQFEVGTDERATSSSFKARHNLMNAGEGFALPDLSILPRGETVELRWNGSERKFQPVEFLPRGSAILSRDTVFEQLQRLVEQVVSRLDDQGLSETALHEEWRGVTSLEGDERDFAIASAALGVDPFSATAKEEAGLLRLDSAVPAEAREEFLAIASPKDIMKQINWLTEMLGQLGGQSAGVKALATFRDSQQWWVKSLAEDAPWQIGRARAKELRKILGINGDPINADILSLFGAEKAEARTAITYRGSTEILRPINALTSNDASGAPKFLITKKNADARRFALCRAIFDYMSKEFEAVDLVVDSNSNKQKTNRAFAAEFLAPEEGLRHRIKSDYVTVEQIDELANEFKVSTWVIQNQIAGRHIAEIEEMGAP